VSFAHPLLLVLGIACLALLAAAYRGFARRKTANALTYSNLAFAAAALRASRAPGRLLLAGFLVSGAALAIAIGGPRFFSRVPSHDATVVICIDTSGSMRAEDLTPTRSAAAQEAARAFVAAAPSGTRIGIVTFSTGASVLLAPTSDLEVVRDALDRIPPPNGGTAIGDALELAASTMPAQGQRAIVLLTDGVNNRGVDPVQASQQVGAQGIRIETVGSTSTTCARSPATATASMSARAMRRNSATPSGGLPPPSSGNASASTAACRSRSAAGSSRSPRSSRRSASGGSSVVHAEAELRPYRERCATRRVELDAALARIVAYAARTPDIARVVVFGSYARDRTSPWSDLDLVIVRDGGPPDLVDDVYRVCGVPGDAIGMRTADFPERLRMTPLGRTIIAEGTSVYARPD